MSRIYTRPPPYQLPIDNKTPKPAATRQRALVLIYGQLERSLRLLIHTTHKHTRKTTLAHNTLTLRMSCAHHLFHITTRSPLGPVFASAFACAQHADVLRMCKGCIAIDCRREDMRAVLALYDILTHQLCILREGETGWRISICQSNYYGVRSGYRTGSQVHTHTHT